MVTNFPRTKVLHLPITFSDHSSLLVALDNPYMSSFPFRCKEVWLEHLEFTNFFISNWDAPNDLFVKGRENFLRNISNWNHME